MKKRVVAIVIVALVLFGGGLGFRSYYNDIDASDVPIPMIRVADQDVLPTGADFTLSVLGGLFEKPVLCTLDWDANDPAWTTWDINTVFDMPEDPSTRLGILGEAPHELTIDVPNDFRYSLSLMRGFGSEADEVVSLDSGEVSDSETKGFVREHLRITQADEYYRLLVALAFNEAENMGEDAEGLYGNALSGEIHYQVTFSIKNPEPVFTPGRTELAQGDILSLKLENLQEGIVPTVESELGPAVFTKGAPGVAEVSSGETVAAEEIAAGASETAEGFANWYATVPIGNTRAPGTYPVTVNAGELVYETSVTVSLFDFDFQNMIIDTSVPSVAAAITGDAIAEFREKVTPLLSQFSEERYWEGLFVPPVELGDGGFISTEFGEIRITNSDESTRRSHYGMDFAVSTGTPVYAGGAGEVLLAEFLLNTGNTVVIDHGGGLKAFYYHMDSLDTTAGRMVARGDPIGKVGSTGYSTGPHLHYEMRIGEQAISPSMLFDAGAGLYSAG